MLFGIELSSWLRVWPFDGWTVGNNRRNPKLSVANGSGPISDGCENWFIIRFMSIGFAQRFLGLCFALTAVWLSSCGGDEIPISGIGTTSLDERIVSIMEAYQIQGAAMAVVRDGRLIVARGYGYADGETRMQPDHRFRIASVSKPITAAAVLKLIEEGRLDLSDRAVDRFGSLLDGLELADDRFGSITVAHLLYHTAGWDREQVPDPMFNQAQIMETLRLRAPPTAQQILRWLARRSLQFTPGSRFAYHNLTYLVLGRIIEQVTGQSYGDYIQQSIFAPSGIKSAALARSLREDRLPNEVAYFYQGRRATSIFDPAEQVSVPYGGMGGALEPMDSHGGWVMSAPDMARFGASVDGESTFAELLSAEMRARLARDAGAGYGAGWFLNPPTYSHSGGLPGTATMLMVDPSQRTVIAIAMNTTPIFGTPPTGALFSTLFQAARDLPRSAEDPGIDLFERF